MWDSLCRPSVDLGSSVTPYFGDLASRHVSPNQLITKLCQAFQHWYNNQFANYRLENSIFNTMVVNSAGTRWNISIRPNAICWHRVCKAVDVVTIRHVVQLRHATNISAIISLLTAMLTDASPVLLDQARAETHKIRNSYPSWVYMEYIIVFFCILYSFLWIFLQDFPEHHYCRYSQRAVFFTHYPFCRFLNPASWVRLVFCTQYTNNFCCRLSFNIFLQIAVVEGDWDKLRDVSERQRSADNRFLAAVIPQRL